MGGEGEGFAISLIAISLQIKQAVSSLGGQRDRLLTVDCLLPRPVHNDRSHLPPSADFHADVQAVRKRARSRCA
jgi:hypothetical protein